PDPTLPRAPSPYPGDDPVDEQQRNARGTLPPATFEGHDPRAYGVGHDAFARPRAHDVRVVLRQQPDRTSRHGDRASIATQDPALPVIDDVRPERRQQRASSRRIETEPTGDALERSGPVCPQKAAEELRPGLVGCDVLPRAHPLIGADEGDVRTPHRTEAEPPHVRDRREQLAPERSDLRPEPG